MPLFVTPPRPGVRFVLAVPARNEEQRICATLTALAAQVDGTGRPLPSDTYEVLLLANNCTDRTAPVARDFAHRHPAFALHVAEVSLPPEDAHAGGARRLVTEEAVRRLHELDKPTGLVCTTDADTSPFPDWLYATAVEAAAGADAVCGRIFVERDAPSGDPLRTFYVQDTAFRLLLAELEGHIDPPSGDPLPRHFQHFGASFAVTARALRRIGGVPSVPVLEDVALFHALQRENLTVRHAPAVRVQTSARRGGRAILGLSTQLTEWDVRHRAGEALCVDDPVYWEHFWHRRRAVRAAVPSAQFAAAWQREADALPPAPPREAMPAIAWLRQRLRALREEEMLAAYRHDFRHTSSRYVSARKPVTCVISSSGRAANALCTSSPVRG